MSSMTQTHYKSPGVKVGPIYNKYTGLVKKGQTQQQRVLSGPSQISKMSQTMVSTSKPLERLSKDAMKTQPAKQNIKPVQKKSIKPVQKKSIKPVQKKSIKPVQKQSRQISRRPQYVKSIKRQSTRELTPYNVQLAPMSESMPYIKKPVKPVQKQPVQKPLYVKPIKKQHTKFLMPYNVQQAPMSNILSQKQITKHIQKTQRPLYIKPIKKQHTKFLTPYNVQQAPMSNIPVQKQDKLQKNILNDDNKLNISKTLGYMRHNITGSKKYADGIIAQKFPYNKVYTERNIPNEVVAEAYKELYKDPYEFKQNHPKLYKKMSTGMNISGTSNKNKSIMPEEQTSDFSMLKSTLGANKITGSLFAVPIVKTLKNDFVGPLPKEKPMLGTDVTTPSSKGLSHYEIDIPHTDKEKFNKQFRNEYLKKIKKDVNVIKYNEEDINTMGYYKSGKNEIFQNIAFDKDIKDDDKVKYNESVMAHEYGHYLDYNKGQLYNKPFINKYEYPPRTESIIVNTDEFNKKGLNTPQILEKFPVRYSDSDAVRDIKVGKKLFTDNESVVKIKHKPDADYTAYLIHESYTNKFGGKPLTFPEYINQKNKGNLTHQHPTIKQLFGKNIKQSLIDLQKNVKSSNRTADYIQKCKHSGYDIKDIAPEMVASAYEELYNDPYEFKQKHPKLYDKMSTGMNINIRGVEQ